MVSMLCISDSPYSCMAWIAISEKALLEDPSGCDSQNIIKVGVICSYDRFQELCDVVGEMLVFSFSDYNGFVIRDRFIEPMIDGFNWSIHFLKFVLCLQDY